MPDLVLTPGLDPFTVVAILVPLALLFFASYLDLARRKDLSARRKVMWAVIIFFLVYVGVALYFFMRPPRPPEGKRYGETASRSRELVGALEGVHAEYAAGTLSDQEYLSRKRSLLGIELSSH